MITLQGSRFGLEPLAHHHVEPLLAAASENRGTYAYTVVPGTLDATKSYVDTALAAAAAGEAVPFAVRDLTSDRIVGSTRFMDITRWSGREAPDAVEIGHTWYAASSQRTACNTEVKLLMLTHAFETWQVVRVTLKTDARNLRSRTAIERIGGRFEGIRRAHQLAWDGVVRDTAYFSILQSEWPQSRAFLRSRLEAGG